MTDFTTPILEGTTRLYTCTLDILNDAQLSGIKLTLVDDEEDIVNARDALEVLNANGGTLAAGVFSFLLTALDTALDPDEAAEVQTRYIHLTFWVAGEIVDRHEATFYVSKNHIPG
jgi:hypothetical protein